MDTYFAFEIIKNMVQLKFTSYFFDNIKKHTHDLKKTTPITNILYHKSKQFLKEKEIEDISNKIQIMNDLLKQKMVKLPQLNQGRETKSLANIFSNAHLNFVNTPYKSSGKQFLLEQEITGNSVSSCIHRKELERLTRNWVNSKNESNQDSFIYSSQPEIVQVKEKVENLEKNTVTPSKRRKGIQDKNINFFLNVSFQSPQKTIIDTQSQLPQDSQDTADSLRQFSSAKKGSYKQNQIENNTSLEKSIESTNFPNLSLPNNSLPSTMSSLNNLMTPQNIRSQLTNSPSILNNQSITQINQKVVRHHLHSNSLNFIASRRQIIQPRQGGLSMKDFNLQDNEYHIQLKQVQPESQNIQYKHISQQSLNMSSIIEREGLVLPSEKCNQRQQLPPLQNSPMNRAKSILKRSQINLFDIARISKKQVSFRHVVESYEYIE